MTQAAGRCECTDLVHSGGKKGECGVEVAPKHVRCRPCTRGNHERRVCAAYKAIPVAAHLDRRCAECGIDSALHPLPKELG